MNANVIRPFLRTLSCFSLNAQRCYLINSKRRNNYLNVLYFMNIERNLRCRNFCSNSSEMKDKLDAGKNTDEIVTNALKNFQDVILETETTPRESVKDGYQDKSGNSSETADKLDNVENNATVEDGSGEIVKIYFKNFQDEVFEINAKIGQSVLEAAKEGGLDMPGACVGQLTCTTCHVYVDETCDFLLENISIQEDDMLDKAPFLKENSRLSCQIPVTKELEGKTFILPKATRNFAVDGYVFDQH